MLQLIDTTLGGGDNLKAGGDKINAMFAELYLGRGARPQLTAVLDALRAGQSQVWSVFSDSTGVYTPGGSLRWVYRTALQISSALGAGVRVVVHPWLNNDSTPALNLYQAPTVVAEGTAGERFAQFDGSASVRSRAVASETCGSASFSQDAEWRVRFAPDSYTPAARQTIFARGASGNRCFVIALQTNGDITLTWYPVAGSDTSVVFTVTAAQHGLSTAAIADLKFTLTADNGQGGYTVTAFKSTNNGGTWTQIAQTITTTGGATSVGRPATGYNIAPWEIGARATTVEPFAGKIYHVQMRDGINGAPLLPPSIEAFNYIGGSTLGGSPTLHVFLGAAVGKALNYMLGVAGAYAGGATSVSNGTDMFRRLLHPMMPGLITLNNGHNEGNFSGAQYVTELNAWLAAVRQRNPLAAVSLNVQNPEIVGTAVASLSNAQAHANRQRVGQGWAAQNGFVAVDAMADFATDPRGLAALVSADGVHPIEPDGYIVEAASWCRAFGVAVPTA